MEDAGMVNEAGVLDKQDILCWRLYIIVFIKKNIGRQTATRINYQKA